MSKNILIGTDSKLFDPGYHSPAKFAKAPQKEKVAIASFVKSFSDAWVLLVEINR